MRFTYLLLAGAILSSAALTLTGCLRDECRSTLTYVRFEPIFIIPDDFRNTTAVAEAPRPLRKPGKLYAMGHYLLINERHEGIHVFDNSDPNRPPVSSIPGHLPLPGTKKSDQWLLQVSIFRKVY
ncbi:MAG: hypothetical protein RMJ33_07935 [Saprospiraceae bacterium]|nr:hypothetical protein [Saprospiraceae bacterium]MDW8229754.1 hypothetical protein [Saprospiraceae bacterium]